MLASAYGMVEVALAAAIAAPIAAAAASGRPLEEIVRYGLGGVGVLAVASTAFATGSGPGFPIFVGVLVSFLVRWETDVQLCARLLGSVATGMAVWTFTSYPWELHWLFLVSIPPVLAAGLADEVADALTDGDDVTGLREALDGVSRARKLTWATWICVVMALVCHATEVGSPFLFIWGAVLLGISGAAASFSEPEVEGEVRAVNFVLASLPPLVVFGLVAILFVLLAQSDESWW